MATFFKSSRVWVIDFTYQGRARRWVKAFADGTDVKAEMLEKIAAYYGGRGQLESVRLADEAEENQYLRGEVPGNMLCPTGRRGTE